MYNLSEKAIAEKYEDLLFTKVMALYAAEESEKILSEIENEEPADPKNIEKIYSKTERRENFSTLWKVSKKLITFAAMVVFVAVVSLSSVVVASAEAREAVAEAIYHLVLRKTDRYTEVSIGNSTGFIDPELYDWEGAYAPTYIPEGFVFSEKQELTTRAIITYSNGEKYFSITQSNQTSNLHMDTENAQKIEAIKINDSTGLLVEKNGFSSLAWNDGSNFFWLRGETDSAELIKVAEGLKPLGKTETEEPAEEYEFIDAEVFNWEGAYAPTYIPEGFVFSEKQELPSKTMIVYSREKEHFIISQATSGITRVDTENAQVVKNILIGDSEALYVEKNNFTYIVWMSGDVCLSVTGKISSDEAVKIAEGIKPIGKTEEPAEEYEFVDPEIYTWDNAYGMTYVPENFIFINSDDLGSSQFLNYRNGEKVLSFIQSTDTSSFVDSENADSIKNIIIGTSEALLITKSDWSCISWTLGNKLLQLSGNVSTEEIIKIAEGIKPLGKTETEEPAEEYEFIDEDVFYWNGAYAPTYIPEGFEITSKDYLNDTCAITYSKGGESFVIYQITGSATISVDTENADISKEIKINNSSGLYVVKDNNCSISWNEGKTLLWLTGEVDEKELLKVAEGMKFTGENKVPKEYPFFDPENYDWEGAFAPTFVPEGFVFSDMQKGENVKLATYTFEDSYFYFTQTKNLSYARIDTENAEVNTKGFIGNSEALFIHEKGFSSVVWSVGDTYFSVEGIISLYDAVKIAQHIRPIN